MINGLIKASVGAAFAAGVALSPASAVSAFSVSFGQDQGSGVGVTATQTSATSTEIVASATPVDITQFLGYTPQTTVYFSLTADSTSTASTQFIPGTGLWIIQAYSGNFSFNSAADGSGTNYLSGLFSGTMTFGSADGNGATLTGSQPGATISFLSDVVATNPTINRNFSFSFTSLDPSYSICDSTVCGFTANVAGTASATAVPEPASWALMVGGFGMLGAAMRRRKPMTAVRFG